MCHTLHNCGDQLEAGVPGLHPTLVHMPEPACLTIPEPTGDHAQHTLSSKQKVQHVPRQSVYQHSPNKLHLAHRRQLAPYMT